MVDGVLPAFFIALRGSDSAKQCELGCLTMWDIVKIGRTGAGGSLNDTGYR